MRWWIYISKRFERNEIQEARKKNRKRNEIFSKQLAKWPIIYRFGIIDKRFFYLSLSSLFFFSFILAEPETAFLGRNCWLWIKLVHFMTNSLLHFFQNIIPFFFCCFAFDRHFSFLYFYLLLTFLLLLLPLSGLTNG